MKIQRKYLHCSIELNWHKVGQDLCITCFGGNAPHVGAVCLAEPYPASEGKKRVCAGALTAYGHQDFHLAQQIAQTVAKALQLRVSVTCGIHYEHITKEQIEEIMNLCNEMCNELIADWEEPPVDAKSSNKK